MLNAIWRAVNTQTRLTHDHTTPKYIKKPYEIFAGLLP